MRRVGWIEKNLGISRKTIRVYEEKGLLPAREDKSKYREYSEEEIDYIWNIKLLSKMKFSLDDIVKLFSSDQPEQWMDQLKKKTQELEEEKAELEVYINFLKTIQLMGRYPSRPKKMGDMKIDDFIKYARDNWNIANNSGFNNLNTLGVLLSKDTEKMEINEIVSALEECASFSGIDVEKDRDLIVALFSSYIELINLAQNTKCDFTNNEVQSLIEKIYQFDKIFIARQLGEVSKKDFARLRTSQYLVGDLYQPMREAIGKKGCIFLANAFAYFGGYSSYTDVD